MAGSKAGIGTAAPSGVPEKYYFLGWAKGPQRSEGRWTRPFLVPRGMLARKQGKKLTGPTLQQRP